MYRYLIPKYGKNHQLVYTDTDSFISHIYTDDYYEDIIPDVEERFDTGDPKIFPPGFKTKKNELDFPTGKNYKVPGLMGDELGVKFMRRFCGLRSKCYCVEYEDGAEKIRCKGVTKQATKDIGMEDFISVLNNRKIKIYKNMNVIRSHDHTIFTETVYKKVLDGDDDKRIILSDGIHTVPKF